LVPIIVITRTEIIIEVTKGIIKVTDSKTIAMITIFTICTHTDMDISNQLVEACKTTPTNERECPKHPFKTFLTLQECQQCNHLLK